MQAGGIVPEHLAVAARKVRDLSWRALRHIARRLGTDPTDAPAARVAVLLPSRADELTLGDASNRIAWYFGGADDSARPSAPITLYVPDRLVDAAPVVPEEQRNVLSRSPRIRSRPRSELSVADHDLVVVWSARDLLAPRVLPALGRVRLVDEAFYSSSATAELAAAMARVDSASSGEDLASLFRSNFSELLERGARSSESLVLGTGPSAEDILETDVDDTAVVVCNSIVKNERLLRHLKPVAVCFADPVFHFGPSEYAFRFRDDLLRVVMEHDSFAVVPLREARLLLRHHPELRDRLVGIRPDAPVWTVPSPDDLTVRPTANILTLFMLPVAASLSRRVAIGGCDGREPGETYFWKHGSSVQYEGLMRTVFRSHPAFFRDRFYEDYYEEHCRLLEDQLSTLEAEGWTFANVTRSFVPALARRGRRVA